MSEDGNNRKHLGTTANGIKVSYDSVSSHAMTHFEDSTGLFEAVQQIIPNLELETGKDLYESFDVGRKIGMSGMVEIDSSDDIVYALRKNRTKYAPFTKTRKPEPTQEVTVVMKPLNSGEYDLYSAWIGPVTPSLPGDKYATDESVEFWNTHALIWGDQEIQPGTETTKCPW